MLENLGNRGERVSENLRKWKIVETAEVRCARGVVRETWPNKIDKYEGEGDADEAGDEPAR